MKNYRPVSLLSIASKVMEKIIKISIMNFLYICRKNLLLAYQFGFRSGLGAVDLLTALNREGLTSINRTYCSARNKTTTAINRAKRAHFQKQASVLADPNCTSSKWWRIARDLCGLKGSASTCLPPLLDSAGDVVSESKAKANLLNYAFVHQNTSLNPDAVVFGPDSNECSILGQENVWCT